MLIRDQVHKPFRCRHCGEVLGYTTGTRLLLGAAYIELTVTLQCVNCGVWRKWRPGTVDEDLEARVRALVLQLSGDIAVS